LQQKGKEGKNIHNDNIACVSWHYKQVRRQAGSKKEQHKIAQIWHIASNANLVDHLSMDVALPGPVPRSTALRQPLQYTRTQGDKHKEQGSRGSQLLECWQATKRCSQITGSRVPSIPRIRKRQVSTSQKSNQHKLAIFSSVPPLLALERSAFCSAAWQQRILGLVTKLCLMCHIVQRL
jgi:hypothetical protein